LTISLKIGNSKNENLSLQKFHLFLFNSPVPHGTFLKYEIFNFTGMRVLIAEDDSIQMMIAEKILHSKNAIVLKATNGLEAVKLVDNGANADIILLDLEMPVMDGYTALGKIKEKLPSVPVLAFTANVLDKEMQASLLQKGFTGSISKPFKPEVFCNTIFAALKKEIF
jgi:CheY-like chemotaxis protein